MSHSYVENRRSELENYIWPEFGDKRLDRITTGDIEDFMMGLRTNASSTSTSSLMRSHISS